MFHSKTVIVVGAGASSEVGLPIGTGLAKRIAELLDVRFDDFGSRCISGDGALFHQLSRGRDGRELQQAAWLIRDGVGLANSIDDFLERHQSNALALLYGKAAIVRAVLEAERRSKIFWIVRQVATPLRGAASPTLGSLS
jgi:hypothetical protein